MQRKVALALLALIVKYILKYASTGEDFTSMEVLIDKTTGVQYILVITPTGVAITPRMDDFQSNGLYHAR